MSSRRPSRVLRKPGLAPLQPPRAPECPPPDSVFRDPSCLCLWSGGLLSSHDSSLRPELHLWISVLGPRPSSLSLAITAPGSVSSSSGTGALPARWCDSLVCPEPRTPPLALPSAAFLSPRLPCKCNQTPGTKRPGQAAEAVLALS